MCGRLNVIDDAVCQFVAETLGLKLNTVTNHNLCPSQSMATIIKPPSGFEQVNAQWGIKPSWSPKLLINAKAETINNKPTLNQAFSHSRCLVPFNSWFEWKSQNGQKQKYEISRATNQPMFMAGILYNPAQPQLVTLTTEPHGKCAAIHHRMPVIIANNQVDYWFNSPPNELSPLLHHIDETQFQISAVN
ncbi:SOS response-associated peptidase [Colwellia sp. MEBiC06753]